MEPSCNEGSDSLHCVTKEELPILLQWLEDHLPHSWKIYATVRDTIKGKWQGCDIYSLGWPDIRAVGEGPPSDCCKIPTYFQTEMRKLSIFSPSKDDAKTLLTWPGFIDWTKPITFQATPYDLGDTIESLCKIHSGCDDVTIRDNHDLMMVKPEDFVERSAPPNVRVRGLDPDADTEFAASNWEHRHELSDIYTQELIRSFPSVVVLDRDGNYLGCEVGSEFGTIGMLYVIPEARGQGLGSYITCQLVKKFFKYGLPALVTVSTGNALSIRLHEALGFKKICNLEWIIHMENRAGYFHSSRYDRG